MYPPGIMGEKIRKKKKKKLPRSLLGHGLYPTHNLCLFKTYRLHPGTFCQALGYVSESSYIPDNMYMFMYTSGECIRPCVYVRGRETNSSR